MDQKLTKEQINKAVEWWSSIIAGNPKFQTLSDTERMDRNNEAAGFAETMATASRKNIEPEAIEKFKSELHKRLSAPEYNPFRGLSVDYNPDKILHESAEAAGIDVGMNTFPWKTNMNFRDGKVSVKYGYGAELKVI